MTTKAPVVPILIGNLWTEPSVAKSTPVHQPSSGVVLARAPHCTKREVDVAVRIAREAFPGWARTPAPERARVLFRYRELLEARLRGAGAAGRVRERQDPRGSPRGRPPRHRGRRVRLRRRPSLQGGDPAGAGARHRRLGDARAAGSLRRHHAVQLSGDGADVDVPPGDRLRQQLRPQAEREGAAHRQPPRRAVPRGRPAPRGPQRRPRRQGGGRGPVRAPGGRRGQLRRLFRGRRTGVRAGRPARQAGAVGRRRQERAGGDAGRGRERARRGGPGPGPYDRCHNGLRLRLRRGSAAWPAPC